MTGRHDGGRLSALSDCHDIETLRNMPPEDTARLVSLTERVFSCYDEITLDGTQKKLFMNGMILDCGRMIFHNSEGKFCSVLSTRAIF